MVGFPEEAIGTLGTVSAKGPDMPRLGELIRVIIAQTSNDT